MQSNKYPINLKDFKKYYGVLVFELRDESGHMQNESSKHSIA